MLIEASPYKDVMLEAFDRTKYPAWVAIARAMSLGADTYFVVLENRAERDIFGLQGVWMAEDGYGEERRVPVKCDGLDRMRNMPVVRAGARLLLTTRVFLPEPTGAMVGEGGFAGSMNAAPVAQFTRMAVDAIVFSDGALYGDDTLGYAEEIPARFAAAKTIATAARKAMERGQLTSDALVTYLALDERTKDSEAKWLRSYAHMVTALGSMSMRIVQYLESMPEPPAIRRG